MGRIKIKKINTIFLLLRLILFAFLIALVVTCFTVFVTLSSSDIKINKFAIAFIALSVAIFLYEIPRLIMHMVDMKKLLQKLSEGFNCNPDDYNYSTFSIKDLLIILCATEFIASSFIFIMFYDRRDDISDILSYAACVMGIIFIFLFVHFCFGKLLERITKQKFNEEEDLSFSCALFEKSILKNYFDKETRNVLLSYENTLKRKKTNIKTPFYLSKDYLNEIEISKYIPAITLYKAKKILYSIITKHFYQGCSDLAFTRKNIEHFVQEYFLCMDNTIRDSLGAWKYDLLKFYDSFNEGDFPFYYHIKKMFAYKRDKIILKLCELLEGKLVRKIHEGKLVRKIHIKYVYKSIMSVFHHDLYLCCFKFYHFSDSYYEYIVPMIFKNNLDCAYMSLEPFIFSFSIGPAFQYVYNELYNSLKQSYLIDGKDISSIGYSDIMQNKEFILSVNKSIALMLKCSFLHLDIFIKGNIMNMFFSKSRKINYDYIYNPDNLEPLSPNGYFFTMDKALYHDFIENVLKENIKYICQSSASFEEKLTLLSISIAYEIVNSTRYKYATVKEKMMWQDYWYTNCQVPELRVILKDKPCIGSVFNVSNESVSKRKSIFRNLEWFNV